MLRHFCDVGAHLRVFKKQVSMFILQRVVRVEDNLLSSEYSRMMKATETKHTGCKENCIRQRRASGFCDRLVNSVLNLPNRQAKI